MYAEILAKILLKALAWLPFVLALLFISYIAGNSAELKMQITDTMLRVAVMCSSMIFPLLSSIVLCIYLDDKIDKIKQGE